MPITVAIVGSGPSGFYTAEALIKSGVDCEVDIVERLPAPHGLIRYGVAPDHQTTKNVSRSFDKTAAAAQVRYFGNVEVGRDVSLDQLKGMYDAVVLAVGSPFDRKLGLPGEDKAGVFGAAEFVGWYNGHPDFRNLNPKLDTEAAAVVGVGNVAVDIARVLVKTRAELASSDIAAYADDAIQAAPINDVYMFGRRSPAEAKFTNVELREMGRLDNAHPVVDPAQLPDAIAEAESDRDRRLKERNLATLREFTELDPAGKDKRVHFAFCASPVEVLGGERVEGLRLERTRVVDGRAVGTGEFFEVACGLVLTAIGYQGQPLDGMPFDERGGIAVNDAGRVGDGVYAVGWIRRGPTGVIGTNKPDGRAAAEQIVQDCGAGEKPGRQALEPFLAEAGVRVVSYDEWRRIDAAEVAGAEAPSPRRKFVTIEEMLAVLDPA
ncbi:MAG: FAD-dependent oxidoreductase [Alphaproteobacteria bacterium]|jgi:ferredoxin--NADP+ reductase|nr:FAD-dependent oxidoreductase [Alphaproteobacteria bacterium]